MQQPPTTPKSELKVGDQLTQKVGVLVYNLEVIAVDEAERSIEARIISVTYVREPYLDGEDTNCGFRWYYRVYDETEWDTCGSPAVGCSIEDDEYPGRCFQHLPNYDYIVGDGYIPKPNEVIELLDRPPFLGEDNPMDEYPFIAGVPFDWKDTDG